MHRSRSENIRHVLFDDARRHLLRVGVSESEADVRIDGALEKCFRLHPDVNEVSVTFDNELRRIANSLMTPEEEERWLQVPRLPEDFE
jgi:hypothetical protein